MEGHLEVLEVVLGLSQQVVQVVAWAVAALLSRSRWRVAGQAACAS